MNTCRTTGYPQCSVNVCGENSCCAPTSALPEKTVVAMAYIPYQECNDVYPCDKALCVGTVFPVLDKPFLAGCCR
ncbi:MAG: spore coat associated protein CotJA [Oscillospiraceae bacterium]|nr:spore coat associated protein CotJA [Oscillospiraceae bacterium]MDD6527432.1 spore coat associated protein CotJA [Oscillospiraceae bacterium]